MPCGAALTEAVKMGLSVVPSVWKVKFESMMRWHLFFLEVPWEAIIRSVNQVIRVGRYGDKIYVQNWFFSLITGVLFSLPLWCDIFVWQYSRKWILSSLLETFWLLWWIVIIIGNNKLKIYVQNWFFSLITNYWGSFFTSTVVALQPPDRICKDTKSSVEAI